MRNIKAITGFVFILCTCFGASAQIGVGTTSPNSTLDVRGSLSVSYRAFTSATAAAITDNTLVFTGTSAATLTLPTAASITGRIYWVKNTSSNASVLTIATTASQTIDGLASWTLPQTNKAVCLVSDGTNWLVASESLPGNSSGTPWINGGNNVTSLQNLGTTSNYDLPFLTNNTEKMRLTSAGSLGVGTATFNGTYPERLLVDAGASGNTNYQNVIVGKGNTNSYAQLNIQNINSGTGASSDVVATADNGNETTNYIDMGINSSVNTNAFFGNANDAYLYNAGQNLLVGTSTAAKSVIFLTGGTSQSTNERMRIDGTGNVGIGTASPGNKLEINSGTGGVSGLRLKQMPAGGLLFMSSTADVTENNSNLYFDNTNYRLSIGAGTSPASTLQVGGSFAAGIVTKTANYTASVSDHTILCNNTAGAITIGLPAAAGATGRIYVIKKISAAGNDVILGTYFGAETIDGSFSYTITTQYNSLMIQSNGTAWFILSKN